MTHQDLPLVSVIIPVFNADKYLETCIQSVIQQSYPAIELIIVDNGSTDNSKVIAKKYPNILFLEEQRKGAAIARNTGIKASKGKYIQFLDADDLLHSDKIQNQIELLNNSENCLALCPTVYFFDGENPEEKEIVHEWFATGSKNTTDFLIKLYGGSLVGPQYGGMIQPNAWLTPKKLIEQAGLWDETLTLDDDGEFFCRVILAANEIRYAPESLNFYRKFKQGNNLSAKKSEVHFISQQKANELKCQYLLALSNNELSRRIFARIFYDSAFTFYPNFKNLSKKAELMAKNLNSDYKFEPYQPGLKSIISKIMGWKTMRILEKLKARLHE